MFRMYVFFKIIDIFIGKYVFSFKYVEYKLFISWEFFKYILFFFLVLK